MPCANPARSLRNGSFARLAWRAAPAFAAPTVTCRSLFAFLLPALVLASAVRANDVATEEVRPSIESDTTSFFDFQTREAVFPGNARLVYGDVLLTADEIRYNASTTTAIARGHVVLTRGAQRLVADTLKYDLTAGTYEAAHIRLGQHPIYVAGATAMGDRNSIVIEDAQASVPEPGPLVPSVRASKITVNSEQKLRAEGSAAGLGTVRPLPFGSFQHDLSKPFAADATFTGGYRGSLGVFALVGLQLPVNDTFSLGGDLGYYTRRGLLFGPAGTYETQDGERSIAGSFRSGYIHDHGPRGVDINNDPVPSDRGFFSWEHRQKISENLSLNAQLNYWRDSEVLRDFRPREFFPVQQPDSYVESVYSGGNYFVSAFVRAAPHSWQVVQERLPEIRFDLLPLTLGAGFYERFNASIVALHEETPFSGPELRSHRFDAYYALTRPVTYKDWFSFTPVVGGRLTHYFETEGAAEDGTYTRGLGEVGFDSAVRFSGTFDYKNPRWKIDGLRHLFTPKVSYRYIPKGDKGTPYIPPIDRLAFSTYLQPLGLGDQRNIDVLRDTNTLRLQLDNTLQTRDETYGSRDLVVFNLANDFRFKRRPGERDVSEIHAELGLMPARWLQLGLYQRYSPQDGRLDELNTGITFRDGDVWALRFSNNFLRHELEDYLVDGSYRFNEVFEGVAHLRYNARRSRFDEQSYGIRQKIGTTWRIDYLVTLYNGPRRESKFGLSVQIQALSF